MIFCCGEALIDMIPLATPAGSAFLPVCGGAAWNCAVALGRLGAPVGLIAALSEDAFGARLAAEAEAAGVETRHAPRLGRPTALSLVSLDATGSPRYQIRDEGSATRLVGAADLPRPPGATAAVFGGLSLLHEPSAGAFEALMADLGPETLRVLDLNIRPAQISDPEGTRARLQRMAARADLVKLSDEDLDWLSPEPEQFLAGLLAAGAGMICETRGGAGLRLHRQGGAERVVLTARKVQVVDTIGAGDTFLAGLLAGLHDEGLLSRSGLAGANLAGTVAAADGPLGRALRLGLDAASLSVTRKGVNPPSRAEIAAFRATA